MMFPSFHCFQVDGPKRFEYATCGRDFVWTRRKKILRFQKYADTGGRILNLGLRNNMFVCRSYIKKLLDLRF